MARSAEEELTRMRRTLDNGWKREEASRRAIENRERLDLEHGAERVREAAEFNRTWGITGSWEALERTILNWDLIQAKIANGTWRK